MGPGRSRPGVTVSAAEKRAYADQAAEDLINFYRARAEEINAGGTLLVASFGTGERYRCCDGLYDVLNDALLDLCDTGRIGRDAYRRLVFPIYYRSRDELIAPVLGDDSPLAGRFRIERAETIEIPVPFVERLEPSGDLTVYAEEFTGFLREFTEPILRQSLAEHANLDDLLDAVYERVRPPARKSGRLRVPLHPGGRSAHPPLSESKPRASRETNLRTPTHRFRPRTIAGRSPRSAIADLAATGLESRGLGRDGPALWPLVQASSRPRGFADSSRGTRGAPLVPGPGRRADRVWVAGRLIQNA